MRSAIPQLALRTTFIVGFPGETDAEFEELCEFVATAKFERCGVFTYSYEPDTPAAKLDGHLDEETKLARRDRLMEVQQQVAFDWSEAQVGQELEVIIDGEDPEVPNHFQGRSYADSPEIDALIRVKGKNLESGDFITVKVTGSDGYDLIGKAIGKPR